MAKEMGEGCYYPDLSRRMAQFELTLLDWAEAHKGSRQYVAFADSTDRILRIAIVSIEVELQFVNDSVSQL